LKEIFPAYRSYHGWQRVILLQLALFNWVEETHESLQTTPSMLEAAADSILFQCENWVTFWKEYFLQMWIFRVLLVSFCSNRLVQLSWINTCITPKQKSVLEAEASNPDENWVSYWKEYFCNLGVLKCIKCHFVPNGPFHLRGWNTCMPPENHFCYMLHNLKHRFPVWIELVFEINTSWNQIFKVLLGWFFPNIIIHLSWISTGISREKKTLCVRSRSI
jgi:hypothetical protein